jgi:GNAT superfamily N-acetyltransferase
MKEKIPIQKEFGEVDRKDNYIIIRKFGSEKEVGFARIEHTDIPIPHDYIDELTVFDREQGKGFSSQLMTEVENVSRERGTPIILVDAISKDRNPMAFGMYSKRKGWIEVQDKNQPDVRHYIFGDKVDKNIRTLIRYYS